MEEKRAEPAGPHPQPAFPAWAWQMQGSPAPFLPATAASSGFSTATATGVDAATAAGSVPSGGPRQLFFGYQQLRFPPTA